MLKESIYFPVKSCILYHPTPTPLTIFLIALVIDLTQTNDVIDTDVKVDLLPNEVNKNIEEMSIDIYSQPFQDDDGPWSLKRNWQVRNLFSIRIGGENLGKLKYDRGEIRMFLQTIISFKINDLFSVNDHHAQDYNGCNICVHQ